MNNQEIINDLIQESSRLMKEAETKSEKHEALFFMGKSAGIQYVIAVMLHEREREIDNIIRSQTLTT